MPRPRTISDEEILDRVLALAHRVGPTGVTFAAAAAEVGLSPATLVQRFGTKHEMLLAADRRGVEAWVGALEDAEDPSPLQRVLDGLVGAVDASITPEEMANSVALLQLALVKDDFHASTRDGARRVRAVVERNLAEALVAGELREGTDVVELALSVETVYHGAMIGWAVHREGDLGAWMRARVGAALAPHVARAADVEREDAR